MKKILVAFAAVFAVLGNSLAAEAAKPLRVAVFVGSGARNVGAFRWLQITTCAKDIESIPVDGASVRNGALDGADVLVMPGGWSGGEAETLEADGREKVKDFVRRGGGYIGTCAGCCLAMESHKTHKDMLHMIPYTFGPGGGAADMPIAFNPLAKEMCGIPKKTWKIRYHGGPVPVPSTPVPEADVKVIATYAGDINTMGGPARKSMARQAAVIAGTYGKGRLFVSAVHPESDVNDHEILRCAFKYVSGREVAQWAYPQRKRGQLAVGVMVEDSLGVEMAKLMQLLLVEREFDIDPISAERISEGALRHLDAVLVPNGEKSQSGKKGLYGDNLARTKEFLGRGGRVFAWGTGAEAARKYEPDVTCVVDAEAALAALRAFAAEPVPPPAALPAKVPHPLTAAIYSDKEGSNGTIERMLYFSPEYNLRILKAADYANGGLDGVDLLIQPGGSCKGQYEMLGTNGVEALRRYVLEGGRYYGVCAGAFMGAQVSRPGWPRLGLVPFKGDDPEHYRGSAPIKVALTEEGQKVFEGSAKERKVIYAGGPALIPGDPVPDTDVQVLATYAGRVISTGGGKSGTEPVKTMRGKAAFVGGRVGKGRVFLSCPHPEMTEHSYDLVRAGIKYLTGVAPSPVNLDRVRGSLSVIYRSEKTDAARAFYYDKLMRDRRFDVRTKYDENDYPHVDAIVLASVAKEDDSPALRQFIANGGQLVVVAQTKAERATAEKISGAIIVDSYDKVLKLLEEYMPKTQTLQTEKANHPLKVLMIGNSFSISCLRYLPKVAEASGRRLDLASLYIGGCSLERHCRNIEAAAKKPGLRPYRFDRVVEGRRVVEKGSANIPDALAMDKWDVVTIQQASHFSWDKASYHPWGDTLVAKIRELAPQAKIIVQETWSYPPWDKRLKKFGFDQAEMYTRLHGAYHEFAGKYGLDVIPVGTAAEWCPDRNSLFTKPDFHFNHGEGEYLQALVWTAKLFDVDVRTCGYRPPKLAAARADVLKAAAMSAVRGK